MATGDSVLAISRAWRPSLATTDRKPPMESWCAIRLAAAGSSSMISTSGALLAAFGSCNYAALEDDFDLDGSSAGAEDVWRRVISVFNGEQTASEKRGARDFVLHRIARTM